MGESELTSEMKKVDEQLRAAGVDVAAADALIGELVELLRELAAIDASTRQPTEHEIDMLAIAAEAEGITIERLLRVLLDAAMPSLRVATSNKWAGIAAMLRPEWARARLRDHADAAGVSDSMLENAIAAAERGETEPWAFVATMILLDACNQTAAAVWLREFEALHGKRASKGSDDQLRALTQRARAARSV